VAEDYGPRGEATGGESGSRGERRAPLVGPGIPDQERETVERLMRKINMFEDSVGRDFRERCQRFYRQYRGFRRFRDRWTHAGPNDRDSVLYDEKKHWGAHLHIPMSFRTIESIVPKAIAQMPKLLVLPRDEAWRKNLEAVRLLLDRQQEQINIDLPFQAVMRSGRIYGLGVGKSYWRKEVRPRRRVVRRMFRPGFQTGQLQAEVTFDDPMFEDVDVFDFMWDPYGSDLRTCEWIVHRVWMSTEAVLQRLKEGVWNTESAKTLDEDTVRALGGAGQRYTEIWQDRMEVSGFRLWTHMGRGEYPHELLEWHDGNRVCTLLDRQILVQEAENPCVGYFPFSIYRPTPINKQMVGIGDLEPLEHLQRELDTLRSQRRDAATIALCAGYVFDDQMIDEEDLVFGPGTAIRSNGDPTRALFPLPIREIPGSGYQEESIIRQDLEAVSGMADALDPHMGSASTQTATEAQLVQASLGARIQLSSRRFEIEVVRETARAFLSLDQRMITENRPALQVPEEGVSEDEAWETGAWRQYPIGPGELMGEYEIQVEGGSMAARNVPQDRADAQLLMNMFGHSWYVNPTKPLERALELCGIKHPKAWMKAQEPPIPAAALAFLKLAGVDPHLIEQAVMKARTVTSPQEGPSPDMVTAMMGGAPAAPGVGVAPAGALGAPGGPGAVR
jgi:hypothetical protein